MILVREDETHVTICWSNLIDDDDDNNNNDYDNINNDNDDDKYLYCFFY